MNASEAKERVRPDGLCWWGSGECMKPQTMRSFYCVDHEGPRKPATVESGAGDGEKCKCGHAKEDHREDVFECLAANVVDGVDEECQCDDFEPAKPESGDGLPRGVQRINSAVSAIDAMKAKNPLVSDNDAAIVFHEKWQSALEENERLKGLLRDVASAPAFASNRDAYLIAVHIHMATMGRIKAAVTGE